MVEAVRGQEKCPQLLAPVARLNPGLWGRLPDRVDQCYNVVCNPEWAAVAVVVASPQGSADTAAGYSNRVG